MKNSHKISQIRKCSLALVYLCAAPWLLSFFVYDLYEFGVREHSQI